MKEKFERAIELVKDPHELRLNNMLDPYFLHCDEEARSSQILFLTKGWEKNQRDEIHGGAISSMFDTAMGITAAAFRPDEGGVSTADLQVSFIKPFLKGAFIFTTQITSMGNTLIRATCVAREKESDLIVATASGTFVPYKKSVADRTRQG